MIVDCSRVSIRRLPQGGSIVDCGRISILVRRLP